MSNSLRIEAFTLKAVEREHAWQPEWLVSVPMPQGGQEADPMAPDSGDTWRVDAVSGQVYDGTGVPAKTE
ncbi:hypothetical protein ABZZ79_01755 [Streptomyces sp. NPDC006458]|uniref:hypothetical protein n=1 Tax=Streptomyces sp. NPDC006458 TaxID=3154302 RepID=UPI0033A578E8